MARRSPPRKVTYFEPVRPRLTRKVIPVPPRPIWSSPARSGGRLPDGPFKVLNGPCLYPNLQELQGLRSVRTAQGSSQWPTATVTPQAAQCDLEMLLVNSTDNDDL
jgi:hypothetical protein